MANWKDYVNGYTGAGAGALAGAGLGAVLGSRKKRIRNAVLGALAGAGIGGTWGHMAKDNISLRRAMSGLESKSDDRVRTREREVLSAIADKLGISHKGRSTYELKSEIDGLLESGEELPFPAFIKTPYDPPEWSIEDAFKEELGDQNPYVEKWMQKVYDFAKDNEGHRLIKLPRND